LIPYRNALGSHQDPRKTSELAMQSLAMGAAVPAKIRRAGGAEPRRGRGHTRWLPSIRFAAKTWAEEWPVAVFVDAKWRRPQGAPLRRDGCTARARRGTGRSRGGRWRSYKGWSVLERSAGMGLVAVAMEGSGGVLAWGRSGGPLYRQAKDATSTLRNVTRCGLLPLRCACDQTVSARKGWVGAADGPAGTAAGPVRCEWWSGTGRARLQSASVCVRPRGARSREGALPREDAGPNAEGRSAEAWPCAQTRARVAPRHALQSAGWLNRLGQRSFDRPKLQKFELDEIFSKNESCSVKCPLQLLQRPSYVFLTGLSRNAKQSYGFAERWWIVNSVVDQVFHQFLLKIWNAIPHESCVPRKTGQLLYWAILKCLGEIWRTQQKFQRELKDIGV
jgi:hypothetical protein